MLSSLDLRNIVCFMDLLYGYILITLCQIFLDIRKVYGDVLLESAVLYVWRLVSIYFKTTDVCEHADLSWTDTIM